MKLTTILFATLLTFSLPFTAEAKRSSRKAPQRAAAKAKPAAKPAVTVNETPAAGDDEEEALTFLQRAALNARDMSPFALHPTYSAADMAQSPLATKLVDYAARFLGTRYRLGASGPSAFDCSGFMGWVYSHFGMTLERSSRSQYTQGRTVALDELMPGDLLFFSSRSSGKGNVGHVAMVVSVDPTDGSCEFIHASTRRGVTYQSFPDNGYYSRHFIGARRMLGTEVSASARL